MSNITTFRFPLEQGNEFDIEFNANELTMCYKTSSSNECRHDINLPFEIGIDRSGSDPIGVVTIDPLVPVPPNAVSINPSLKVKLNGSGIHIAGNSKGDKATFKA